MKKEINPVYGIVAVVCVVVIVAYFLYHASTDKPMYPGLNAGHAGHATMSQSDHKMTPAEAAKMHIPGVTPGMSPGVGPPPANANSPAPRP